MAGKNIQIFPSGERREFEFVGLEQKLKNLTRAKGDKSKNKVIGKTMGEMNAIPAFEDVPV